MIAALTAASTPVPASRLAEPIDLTLGPGATDGRIVDVGVSWLEADRPEPLARGGPYPLRVTLPPLAFSVDGTVTSVIRSDGHWRHTFVLESPGPDVRHALEICALEQRIYSDAVARVGREEAGHAVDTRAERAETLTALLDVLHRPRPLLELWEDPPLDPELIEILDRYLPHASRPAFIRRWAWAGCRLTMLGGATAIEDVTSVKVATVLMNMLVDDVVDRARDRGAFETAARILTDGLSVNADTKRPEIEAIARLRAFVGARVRRYPQFAKLGEVLAFDFAQIAHTNRYMAVAHGFPGLLNPVEYLWHESLAMNLMVHLTVDAMSQRTFDPREFGRAREVVLQAGRVARLTNNATLSRERAEGNEIADGEGEGWLARWPEEYDALVRLHRATRIRTLDLTPLVEHMPRFLVTMNLSMADLL